MANYIARDILHYNRATPQEIIDALPEDKFFPIVFAMLHEHKAGKPTEPHMRCMFAVPVNMGLPMIHSRETILVDVEMGIYNMLPEIELPEEAVEKQEEPSNS